MKQGAGLVKHLDKGADRRGRHGGLGSCRMSLTGLPVLCLAFSFPQDPAVASHSLILQALWLPLGGMVLNKAAKENGCPESLAFSHCQAFLPGGTPLPWGPCYRHFPLSWELSSPGASASHPPLTGPCLALTTMCTGGRLCSMLSGASSGDMKGFLAMGDQ